MGVKGNLWWEKKWATLPDSERSFHSKKHDVRQHEKIDVTELPLDFSCFVKAFFRDKRKDCAEHEKFIRKEFRRIIFMFALPFHGESKKWIYFMLEIRRPVELRRKHFERKTSQFVSKPHKQSKFITNSFYPQLPINWVKVGKIQMRLQLAFGIMTPTIVEKSSRIAFFASPFEAQFTSFDIDSDFCLVSFISALAVMPEVDKKTYIAARAFSEKQNQDMLWYFASFYWRL